ncbi:hypothetical protein NDU88_001321, partial [Pleurodeles waltl]
FRLSRQALGCVVIYRWVFNHAHHYHSFMGLPFKNPLLLANALRLSLLGAVLLPPWPSTPYMDNCTFADT